MVAVVNFGIRALYGPRFGVCWCNHGGAFETPLLFVVRVRVWCRRSLSPFCSPASDVVGILPFCVGAMDDLG